MPVTRHLPVSWYETQNIHHVTVDDFRALVKERGGSSSRAARFLSGDQRTGSAMANLFAEHAVFLLRRPDPGTGTIAAAPVERRRGWPPSFGSPYTTISALGVLRRLSIWSASTMRGWRPDVPWPAPRVQSSTPAGRVSDQR